VALDTYLAPHPSQGNKGCHTILRGGTETGPNFGPSSVSKAVQTLKKGKACHKIIIDCSHGNSSKLHTNQPIVCDSVANQVSNGNGKICALFAF
jgi:3-deoxy-7-phosphoheptulonate synthase